MAEENKANLATAELKATMDSLEQLENEKLQESQQSILKELYSLRSTLSKSINSEKRTMEDLYNLRENLKREIDQVVVIQDQLMRREKRIGHLKKNLHAIFLENEQLKKENESLKKELADNQE
jgi:predicted RNase H-like nuclease (RuvC/YqgF family)